MIELDRVRLRTNQSVEYVVDGEREVVANIQRWSIEACVGEALCGEFQTSMMTGKPVAVRFCRVETDEQVEGDVLLTRIEAQIGGLYEIEGLGLSSLRIVTREAQEEDEQIIVEAVPLDPEQDPSVLTMAKARKAMQAAYGSRRAAEVYGAEPMLKDPRKPFGESET